MKDVALPRYHRLAKILMKEGGKWSKGLQNTRSAGDSLWGFPCLGQLAPSLPTLWPRPSTDRDVGFAVRLPSIRAIPPAPQNPGWAQQAPDFPPFPLAAAFFHHLRSFAGGFASISLKIRKAEPRVEALGCVFLSRGV